jgi:hypothetical protein
MKRLLYFLLVLIPAAAFAQVPPRYVAKFVCGKATPLEFQSGAIAPGTYFTAINVHNITGNATANLRKRFSAGQISERVGRVSDFVSVSIPAGNTILIDCRDILGRLGSPPFAEGTVEIFSSIDIDVIGVYTTVGATGQVTTMEIDRVPKH